MLGLNLGSSVQYNHYGCLIVNCVNNMLTDRDCQEVERTDYSVSIAGGTCLKNYSFRRLIFITHYFHCPYHATRPQVTSV